MSAYDITGFLRTAYLPFAYFVPSKTPMNTAYQGGGGCHPQTCGTSHKAHKLHMKLYCETCLKVVQETGVNQCTSVNNTFYISK